MQQQPLSPRDPRLYSRPSGTWRSPVAHLNGVQGVAGSNPAVPIWWVATEQSVREAGESGFGLRAHDS